MTVQEGTITGATLLHKSSFGSIDARETWLVSVSFPAYTASSDTAIVNNVGAALSARARDSKTRTLVAAHTGQAGIDTNGTAVVFAAASSAPLTCSTDDISGELGNAAFDEADRTASSGVGLIVTCDLT